MPPPPAQPEPVSPELGLHAPGSASHIGYKQAELIGKQLQLIKEQRELIREKRYKNRLEIALLKYKLRSKGIPEPKICPGFHTDRN